MADLDAASTPAAARAAFRAGQVRPTCGVAQGYAQANLMILPKEQAFDFLLFAQRNPLAGSDGTGRHRAGNRARSRHPHRCTDVSRVEAW